MLGWVHRGGVVYHGVRTCVAVLHDSTLIQSKRADVAWARDVEEQASPGGDGVTTDMTFG